MKAERFDILILGSGAGGKLLAWHMARSGRPTAVVERRWIGGSCPNVNCMPSKNEIHSAKVASQARRGAEYGVRTGAIEIDMAAVRDRKRNMVDDQIAAHVKNYQASGAELIMGSGRFVAPKTLEVRRNDGGTRVLAGDRVFINVGTHAAIPGVPGLEAAAPLTNIEALELDYLPRHLIVLGGGYVGLEFAQAYRRFGSRVTVIERGPRLMSHEDPDVSAALERILDLIAQVPPRELAGLASDLEARVARSAGADRGRRIALIGLRGAGKSTLGRMLAQHLGWPFVELDRRVEDEYGASIPDLIEMAGSATFRRQERRALEHVIAEHEAAVITTAGGIVANPETYALLLRRTHTIWIKARPQEHMSRVMAQGDFRPMAQNRQAMADLVAILEARRADYARAEVEIDTSGDSPQQSFAKLLRAVERLTGEGQP